MVFFSLFSPLSICFSPSPHILGWDSSNCQDWTSAGALPEGLPAVIIRPSVNKHSRRSANAAINSLTHVVISYKHCQLKMQISGPTRRQTNGWLIHFFPCRFSILLIPCATFRGWVEKHESSPSKLRPIKSIFHDVQNEPWDNVRAAELGQSLSYYLSITWLHNSITRRTCDCKLPARGTRWSVKILIPLMSHSK